MEIEKIALLDTVLNPRKIENIAKYRGNSCFKICMLIGFCCLGMTISSTRLKQMPNSTVGK